MKSAQGDSLQGFIWTFRIPSKRVGVNFSEPKEYNAGGNGMQCIDMNNDGSPDIVTSSGIILINDGQGNFPTQWTINGLDYSFPICANDFNRDGIIDLFYYGTNGLTIGLGDGEGNFQESSLNWYWYLFTIGDFNGDGYSDIAGISVANTDPDNPTTDWGISFNDGKGNFKDTVSIKVAGGGDGNCILPTDIDNDGDIDIVIGTISYCCGPNLTTYGLEGMIVSRNNGKGIFNEYQLYPACNDFPGDPYDLYSSDFNNDNLIDIADLGYRGAIIINKGNGIYGECFDTLYVHSFWGPEIGGSLAGGDVNGDGWIDLAISGSHFPPEMPITSYTVIMNFESNFLNSQGFYNYFTDTLPSSDIFSAALADLDGDDDLDLMHCGSSVYITFNQDTITSVKENFAQPREFYLFQNFPNPFNPTTTIEYTLQRNSNVTIKIYNTLGEQVKTLVNKYQTIGNYKISFNANNLTSGVYFYQLTTGGGIITRKMIYLK